MRLSTCLIKVTGDDDDDDVTCVTALQVIAEDGGTPRRSGSITVDVVVTDVNDNSPRFDNTVYHAEITENAAPQHNVVVVRSEAALFITSVKEVYVLPGVCLSVCLLASSRKKTSDWIFMKILPEMYLWTRKN